jgi:hypothetical protein
MSAGIARDRLYKPTTHSNGKYKYDLPIGHLDSLWMFVCRMGIQRRRMCGMRSKWREIV